MILFIGVGIVFIIAIFIESRISKQNRRWGENF